MRKIELKNNDSTIAVMEYLAAHPNDKCDGIFAIGCFICSADYTSDGESIKDWLEEIIKVEEDREEGGLRPFELDGHKKYYIGCGLAMWILVIGERYYYISC